MSVFVDTWGWLTLRDEREARHQEVQGLYQERRHRHEFFVTSDYVLDEAITLFFRRLPFHLARSSIDMIDQAVNQGYLRLERITPTRFERAKQLRLRYQDKPRISFTDLTSMVVMEELDVTEILTEDAHFQQVGLGFVTVP